MKGIGLPKWCQFPLTKVGDALNGVRTYFGDQLGSFRLHLGTLWLHLDTFWLHFGVRPGTPGNMVPGRIHLGTQSGPFWLHLGTF